MTNIPYEERREVYQAAIEKFGEEAQIKKAIEELGKLLVSICHYPDGKCSREDLADELADATIMCEQLRLIFGVNDEVWHHTDYKIDRLRRRIQGESD